MARYEEIYHELVQLDAPMARYYRSVMARHPNGKLSREETRKLFEDELMDEDTITTQEAHAILLLIRNDQFSPEAWNYLGVRFRNYDVHIAYVRGGGGGHWLSGKNLAGVFDAISPNRVRNIDFRNPITGASYNPCLYEVIKELVRRGHIRVVEFQSSNDAGGVYNLDLNVLVLYRDTPPFNKIGTIVHEFTHAIQDWRDITSLGTHAEADAYIAEAVVYRTMVDAGTIQPLREGSSPNQVAYHKAAPLVLSGDAEGGKAWTEAHEKVVSAVANHKQYKGFDQKIIKKETKGPDEKGIMLQVWKEIKNRRCA